MATPIETKIVVDNSEAKKSMEDFQTAAAGVLGKVGVLLAAAAAGFAAVGKAAEMATNQANELGRASFFGVGIKQAQVFQKQLGGMISEMQALRELTSLRAVGFSDQDTQVVAEMTSKIRALTGASTEMALSMIRTGEGVEKLGEVLGARGLGTIIENQLIKNIGSRVPTAAEKARAAFQVLQRQLSQLRGNFSRADLASPFTKLEVAMKDAQTRIVRKFLPELLQLTKDFEKTIIPAIITGTKAIVSGIKDILEQYRFLKKEMDANNTTLGQTANRFLEIAKNMVIPGKAASTLSKQLLALFKKSKEATKGVTTDQQKQAKATTAAVKKTVGDAAKSLDNLRKKNKKAATQATREALDELLGFQSQAREQVRNFLQFFLNNVSTAGGTVSGVIASFKDIPEQLKILGSFQAFNKVLEQTRKLTLEEIVLRREAGELTDRQAKVAALGNTIRKAGSADLKEFVRNQKTVTQQLRASLAISESQAQLAEVRAAKNDLQTDILTSQAKLNEVILGVRLKMVSLSENELKQQSRLETALQKQAKIQSLLTMLGDRSKQTKQGQKLIDQKTRELKAQRAIAASARRSIAAGQAAAKRAGEIAENARKANVQYGIQAKEQRRLIALMERRAQLVAKELDGLRVTNERFQRINEARQATYELQLKLAEVMGGTNSAAALELENNAKLVSIQTRLNALNQERLELDIKRRTAATTQDQQIAAQQLKTIDSVIASTREQLTLQQQINDVQSHQQTLVGALAARVREAGGEFVNLGKRMGQELGDSISSGLDFAVKRFQFMGKQIANIFSGLKAENVAADLGTGFLELLSGLTGNFAASFAAISAAYIAAGNVPQGIATGAAAAGLGLLSGTLGGFSSIAQKASAPETGSSAASTGAFRQSLSDEPQQLTQRDTRVIFVASESFNGTPEEQWSRFTNRAKELTELTGLNLPVGAF